MMHDVNCPYCGAEIEICYDDDVFSEDVRYEDECPECGKFFVFTTSISISHNAYKADCLNGEEHKLKQSCTFPKELTTFRCKDCGFERKPTEEEMKVIMEENNEK